MKAKTAIERHRDPRNKCKSQKSIWEGIRDAIKDKRTWNRQGSLFIII